jgi:hypothetical protein
MKRPAYWVVVEKSRAACVAAIEDYNRVATTYREESFAILMINAWELLLKARIMQENGGKVSCLYERQPKRKKNGEPSKVKQLKLSRSGLPLTIGIERAWNIVSGYKKNSIDPACIANIGSLLEMRDSATHFVARSPILDRRFAELSLAAVKNYVVAIQKWFGAGFSELNIATIPISFDLTHKSLEAVAKKPATAVTKFLAYMQSEEDKSSNMPSEYAYTVTIEFDLVKKKSDGAVTAVIVGPNDNPDLTVAYAGDSVPPGFTWDYNVLTNRLSQRYADFKQNAKYHGIRQILEKDPKLCFERYLDPVNKSGLPKRFYNPNILKQFDQHYAAK